MPDLLQFGNLVAYTRFYYDCLQVKAALDPPSFSERYVDSEDQIAFFRVTNFQKWHSSPDRVNKSAFSYHHTTRNNP